jgi:4-phosphopantoate--beta-alanine ligase
MPQEHIPSTHPRYQSLSWRNRIIEGYKTHKITGLNGLIAHGRGETFDYLIEEKTQDFAEEAIDAAAHMLINAQRPVISINGNTAALAPEAMIALAEALDCPMEVNIFYSDGKDGRAERIKAYLENQGARKVLLPDKNCSIGFIDSNRRFINPEGMKKSDVVLVPLEDGDRTHALIKNNIKVITVDLNPLSRTAKDATINIVDHLCRCIPLLTRKIQEIKTQATNAHSLEKIAPLFDREKNRHKALEKIRSNA